MGRDHTIFIAEQSRTIKVKMTIVPKKRIPKENYRNVFFSNRAREQWVKDTGLSNYISIWGM